MSIYFSHPVFTYHTETERKCISKIKEKFSEEIINPAGKGFRAKSKEMIDKSDKIIGMAIENKITFLVDKEINYAKSKGQNAYIIDVEDKNLIGEIKEYSEDDFEVLDMEKTKEFKKELRKGFFSLTSFLFGQKNRF